MSLVEEIVDIGSIFIDTAPVIYYIEAHHQYGPIMKDIISIIQEGKIRAYASVITITEVLPKPIEAGDIKLAERFLDFFRYGKNIRLLEISEDIANRAGRLRGKYPSLRTVDAIQIATAQDVPADAFLTNHKALGRIKETRTLILQDYL